jgi:DNA-binding CsgD family transcriptional regulator
MTEHLSPQALSCLIGSIYDCALDPSRWDTTLIEIKDALHCENAILHLNDLRHDRIIVSKIVGMEPYWLERVLSHSSEINLRLAQDLATWPSLDQAHVVSRHMPREFIENSRYVQECWGPQGIVDVIAYFLMNTPTRFSGISFGRHKKYGLIGEREIELGDLLLPHIRRAVTISDVLDANKIERARMSEALDALRCAVVLTDARCAVLHANRSAQSMLVNGGHLQDIGGVLQAKSAAAAAELRAAVRIAAQDEAEIGKAGLAIRLTGSNEPPVFAHVLPMNGGDRRTRLQPSAVAAVFINAPVNKEDVAHLMATAYELTPAETRVLASLLAGRTLTATATALGITVATAKTHLEHIFAKTGVTRQAELMRLLTGFVSPAQAETRPH